MAVALLQVVNMTSKIENKNNRLQSNAEVLKVVVIGGPQVGKTSLIRQYWEHHQPGEMYEHNGATVYPCQFMDDGISMRAAIYEIPGDPAFGQESRTSHYQGANVLVWMYAIDDPESLEILRDEWLPEAEEEINSDGMPSVLVGNKRDLRDNPEVIQRLEEEGTTPVTVEQAGELQHHETIMHFAEISATDLQEVEELFCLILYLGLLFS